MPNQHTHTHTPSNVWFGSRAHKNGGVKLHCGSEWLRSDRLTILSRMRNPRDAESNNKSITMCVGLVFSGGNHDATPRWVEAVVHVYMILRRVPLKTGSKRANESQMDHNNNKKKPPLCTQQLLHYCLYNATFCSCTLLHHLNWNPPYPQPRWFCNCIAETRAFSLPVKRFYRAKGKHSRVWRLCAYYSAAASECASLLVVVVVAVVFVFLLFCASSFSHLSFRISSAGGFHHHREKNHSWMKMKQANNSHRKQR